MLNLKRNKYSVAALLRLAELLVFSLVIFALAHIGAMSSEAYHITRYTQPYEVLRATFLFMVSPVYIITALFFSMRAISRSGYLYQPSFG